ncbi:MAG: phenylalanine--tRNA ligase subunit alpha [Planctomycetota bacterium]|jgi:phenylalanyl-tRNA synthetase alpha chain
MADLEAIRNEALAAIADASDEDALQHLRVRYLGRKSELSAALRGLGKLPREQRAAFGARTNQIKRAVEEALAARAEQLRGTQEASIADTEWLDLSLFAEPPRRGHLHPITQVEAELDHLFRGMGYRVVEGPWVEDEWHNFDALNMPDWHPSRDAWDTFWLSDGNLLRTHTSPVQIRAMKRFGAPLRAVFPGRVFRNEAVDATHEAVFSQLEGLVIDKDITPGHLFHSIQAILSAILEEDIKTRYRPSYFPFTEPSFECDIWREEDWMELCGMGMVHPRVLEAGGLDPREWTGFAFGLGIDRLAMMRWGITDIRWFHRGDLRFLEQF